MTSSGYGGARGKEVSINADGIQFGLLESVSIPYNINVNFDELPLEKAGSSGSLSNTPASANNKNKRTISDSQQEANKKRFVWPDALHRDFLAAVFDIGLKYASPKEVALLMAEHDASVSMDQMKSHIQKFMVFRERKDSEYVSYSDLERGVLPPESSTFPSRLAEQTSNNGDFSEYDDHTKMEPDWNGNSSIVPQGYGIACLPKDSVGLKGRLNNTKPFQPRTVSTISPTVLLSKIEVMGEAINAQTAHLANLKQLIKKQTKMYVMLSQKANQLKSTLPNDLLHPPAYNPFLSNALRNTCSSLYPMNVVTGDSTFGVSYIDATTRNQYNDSFNYNYINAINGPGEDGVAHLNYLREIPSATADSNNTRNGFQFMHEMRTHMDTHRKLLLRKEDQLSQHGGCDFISTLYVHDDGCTSGYNSITDHYKYKEYRYTDEDNKSCYAHMNHTTTTATTMNGKPRSDTETTDGTASVLPVNTDFGITGMGRRPTAQYHSHPYTNNATMRATGSSSGHINSNISSAGGVSHTTEGAHSNTVPGVLGYFYGVSQTSKAVHSTPANTTSVAHKSFSQQKMVRTPSEGSASACPNSAYAFPPSATASGSGGSGAGNGNNSHSSGSVAPIPDALWETELDLESDLFSFLFDPAPML